MAENKITEIKIRDTDGNVSSTGYPLGTNDEYIEVEVDSDGNVLASTKSGTTSDLETVLINTQEDIADLDNRTFGGRTSAVSLLECIEKLETSQGSMQTNITSLSSSVSTNTTNITNIQNTLTWQEY